MGGQASKIPEHELEQFAASTFFTKKEINRVYTRFEELGGSLNNPLDMMEICKIPELRNNPFRYRMCEVFGHTSIKRVRTKVQKLDEDGNIVENADEEDEYSEHEVKEVLLTFNNFLQMLNAFSSRASLQVKYYYAFKMYDFDNDRFINTEDIVSTLQLIVGENRMTAEKMNQVAAAVLAEGDLDGSNRLSQTEFIRIIKRIPDFITKFQFSLDGM